MHWRLRSSNHRGFLCVAFACSQTQKSMKSADSSSKKSAVSSGNRPFSLFSRWVVRAVFFLSCRVYRSWAVPPSQGGYILVANHISHFDPPMIGCWFLRYVDWMAMEELYQAPWSAWLMNALSAFPVKRNSKDAGPMRTAWHSDPRRGEIDAPALY